MIILLKKIIEKIKLKLFNNIIEIYFFLKKNLFSVKGSHKKKILLTKVIKLIFVSLASFLKLFLTSISLNLSLFI